MSQLILRVYSHRGCASPGTFRPYLTQKFITLISRIWYWSKLIAKVTIKRSRTVFSPLNFLLTSLTHNNVEDIFRESNSETNQFRTIFNAIKCKISWWNYGPKKCMNLFMCDFLMLNVNSCKSNYFIINNTHYIFS